MDFFQELMFAGFLAFIFSYAILKLVSFAVSNSSDDSKTAKFRVEEVKLGKGLKVKSKKSRKRVKFADDLVVSEIDHHQDEKGFEIKENRGVENIAEMVDQFEEEELNRESGTKISGLVEDSVDEDRGSESIEILTKITDEGNEIGEICDEEEDFVKENGEDENVDEDKESESIEMVIKKTDEGHEKGEICDEKEDKKDNGEDESVDEDDDDWEGIERSDLEKEFAEAVNYVEYGGKGKEKDDDDRLTKLLSSVQMELYALHKVAVEGECHEPQPMALKVSSRAKWNAWHKLGSMNQEAAMEQYIKLLSDNVPQWKQSYTAEDDAQVPGLKSLPEDERVE